MSPEQLRQILADHAAWRRNEGGKRANLAGTNLAGAYLVGADLVGADLVGADLVGANLAGANLVGANLARANLAGAKIAEGITVSAGPARRATRSDGYEFFLWRTDAGWRVRAGCRFFTMDEAQDHWNKTRAGTALGAETDGILGMFRLHIQQTEGNL